MKIEPMTFIDLLRHPDKLKFSEIVKNRIFLLEQQKKTVETYLKALPDGSLNIREKNGRKQYYLFNNDKKQKYLPFKKMSTVLKLLQKSYISKKLPKICEELALLSKLQEFYETDADVKLCKNQNELLSIQLQKEQEEYIKQWKEGLTQTKNPYPIETPLTTENGESVRSKSEKMAADKFYHRHVIYVYEPKIVIEEQTFFPDLMILNIRTGDVFIYEHFGLLTKEDYCQKALYKIQAYESAGFSIGTNFFITTETGDHPFDGKRLDELIDNYFL